MTRFGAMCLLVVCLLLAGGTLPAAATDVTDPPDYWVVARDSTSINSVHGAAGTNYVMNNPNILDTHVSSVYCEELPEGELVEMGWHAYDAAPSWGGPHYVIFWLTGGDHLFVDLGAAPQGTYHRYSVRRDSGTRQWRFFLDGVQKWGPQTVNFTDGTALASSERDLPPETNYSKFYDLRKLGSNWFDWKFLALYDDHDNGGPFNGYSLNKHSNTSCTMDPADPPE